MLTPDEEQIQKVSKNDKYLIDQLEKNKFVKKEMESSNYVLMAKKIRKFEIEVNALKEPFEQVFCRNQVANKQPDSFELAAMTPLQREQALKTLEAENEISEK